MLTSQPAMFWLNEVAVLNVCDMRVTAETSHAASGWLKSWAWLKVESSEVTRLVEKVETEPMKCSAL